MSFRGLCLNLQRAIISNDFETIYKITIKNSNFKLTNLSVSSLKRFSKSLMQVSIHCKNKKILEFLVHILKKLFERKVKFGDLDYWLKVSVKNGNVRVTQLLIENGAKLVGPMWNDLNLVASLIFNRQNIENRKKMLELLLNNGLDARLKNKEGQNFLHKFADKFVRITDTDAAEVGKILINHGTPVDEIDQRGYKPIHCTVIKSNQLYRLLSKSKSYLNEAEHDLMSKLFFDRISHDINFKVRDGCTILHGACIFNHVRYITEALRRGADVNLVNNEGKTPFGCLNLEKRNYDACVEIVVKEFASLNHEKPLVSRVNMELVESNEKARECYEKCRSELNQMFSTKFYEFYSYYHVLKMTKSIKKLANLMKNENFFSKFESGLGAFNHYEKDLRKIWNESLKIKNKMLIVESKLNAIFWDYIPAVVITKLAENLAVEDLL